MRAIEQVFIDSAQEAQREYGVPASVTLAQWALESDWGTKDLGAYNYFGIKYNPDLHPAGYVERPTREFIDGKWVIVQAKFARFTSVEDAFLSHARLLATSPHYSQAMQFCDDPDKFADELQGVYATDPQYAKKLKAIMKSANLYQYDIEQDKSDDEQA